MSDDKPKPTGPESKHVAAGNDWTRAVGEALKKKKPAAGWPEPAGRYGNKKTRQKSR
jgi:hypothetical protein